MGMSKEKIKKQDLLLTLVKNNIIISSNKLLHYYSGSFSYTLAINTVIEPGRKTEQG
jgi:hypothetical protein